MDYQTYSIDKQQLIQAIRHDCETFLSFYIGDDLDLEIPDVHKEIWDEFLELLEKVDSPDFLTGRLHKLMAIPREHAKTTLTKLAVLLFLRYSRLRFCAYVSNTFGVAMNAIRDVKEWFTSPQDAELYGASRVVKSSETDGLFILDIQVPGYQKPKRIMLKAFGQGTQIRGMLVNNQRPDFLVFDDIEDRSISDSPTQQEKLDAWCVGTAIPAMGRRGVCIMIGNMISDKSLLARLSKEPKWNATVLGSIVRLPDGTLSPLWPGRWSLEELLEDYASYRRIGQGHIWEAERMNMTASEVLGESLQNAIRPPVPQPEDIECGFICLDPAFGQNSWNDESAITVHVRLIGGDIPILIDSTHGRWTHDQVFDEMMAMSYRWGLRSWVIETQAAQKLLIPLFRMLMVQRGMDDQLIHLFPVLAGRESKASRIVSLRAVVAHQAYAVAENQNEFVEKLEGYVPNAHEHDDLCDSGAYGPIVWPLHGEQVRSLGRMDIAGLLWSIAKGESYNSVDMGIP